MARPLTLLCTLVLVIGWTALWAQDARAALSPRTFGREWAEGFNLRAAQRHSRLRVWSIACVREGEAVFYCDALFAQSSARYSCLLMALGSSGEVFSARHTRCTPAELAAAGITRANGPAA